MFKKSTAFLLAVFTVLISVSVVLPAFAVSQGDINGDGKVTATDYIMLKRHVLGTSTLNNDSLSGADMDNDGDVDKIDYIILKRTVLGTLDSTLDVPQTQVVSYGKTYTTNVAPSSTYPDTNAELTDGVFASSSSYDNDSFCGYSSSIYVYIDLGDDGNNLTSFETSYMNANEAAGIRSPDTITVYGSNNNSSWTWLGSVTTPYAVTNSVDRISIDLASPVDYRYIRFGLTLRSHWLFIDELLVYGEATKDDSSVEVDYYETDTLTDSARAQYINSASSGNVYNESLGLSLISAGKSYTFNCAGYDTSRAPQSTSLLTNGADTGSYYSSGAWVGINASQTSSITVNLGSTQSDVCAFALYCYNLESANINLPDYVDVSVSTNNSTYYTVGRAYAPSANSKNHVFMVSLKTLLNARYVRFTFPATEGYVWVEEAAVYANRSSGDNIYGYFEMPLTEIPSYWKSTDSDYNTEQNLLLGKLPEIKSDTVLAYNTTNATYNSPETSSILTDGSTTDGTDSSSDPWFGFYSGTGRMVFFDLGAISSVSDFSVRILHRPSWGINAPSKINVYLSENGKDWYVAGSVSLVTTSDQCIVLSEGSFGKEYRARYVMFRFDLTYHVFMDEITVTGTKSVKNATKLENSGLTSATLDFGYTYAAPSDDLIGGAEDVCLLYHTAGTYDKETLYPYVAYMDKNGNIVDTMFDSFLFLPDTGTLPSGGTPWGTNTAGDWWYLYNELFASGKNFDALEKVTGEVKNLLSMPDYTVKVFVTIPHMDTSLSSFGDIDNDGDNDSLTTLNSRVYVATYYAQQVIAEFESRGYENIELCGFYWFHEEIQGADATTAQYVNRSFDELGMPLFWIPWYCAPGYTAWETNGFDLCCMQPNYAFSDSATESRLETNANYAQKYGMCVEIEVHWDAPTDDRYFKNYMEYLAGGVKYGYMDHSIHMYYQSFNTIGSMLYSDSDKFSLIYDYTYQFIKGSLDIKPDTVDDISITAKANTPCYGTLNQESTDAVLYKVSQSPAHGSLALDENGRFVYYPNKEFKGTDTFTYQISNHLGWSENCTVTVTVE